MMMYLAGWLAACLPQMVNMNLRFLKGRDFAAAGERPSKRRRKEEEEEDDTTKKRQIFD